MNVSPPPNNAAAPYLQWSGCILHMTGGRDKKFPLPLHIPKCIVRVLSFSHVPLPVVSRLSCIAVRAGRACIGCQRRSRRRPGKKSPPLSGGWIGFVPFCAHGPGSYKFSIGH